MNTQEDWRQRAHQLKTETYVLYLAYRDPCVPWVARLWAIIVVAYAFSPIDLIPDFIPVLGYLDDLVLVPLGVLLAIKLIPAEVMTECRQRTQVELDGRKPVNRAAAIIIVGIWLLLAAYVVSLIIRLIQ